MSSPPPSLPFASSPSAEVEVFVFCSFQKRVRVQRVFCRVSWFLGPRSASVLDAVPANPERRPPPPPLTPIAPIAPRAYASPAAETLGPRTRKPHTKATLSYRVVVVQAVATQPPAAAARLFNAPVPPPPPPTPPRLPPLSPPDARAVRRTAAASSHPALPAREEDEPGVDAFGFPPCTNHVVAICFVRCVRRG